MVKFTKNTIIVTIDCKINSVESWLEIKSSMSQMAMLAMTNTDYPVNEYNSYWFTHLMGSLDEMEYEDIAKIQKALV